MTLEVMPQTHTVPPRERVRSDREPCGTGLEKVTQLQLAVLPARNTPRDTRVTSWPNPGPRRADGLKQINDLRGARNPRRYLRPLST